MTIDNKMGKTLQGPSVFIGYTFLFLGIVFLIEVSWVRSVLLLAIAGFLLFTYSGVEINTKNQQVKSYTKIFGLIKIGKWVSLKKFKGVTLVPKKKVYTTFSRSNRQTSTIHKYFEIYLVNKASKPELPIKKCKNIESAQNSLDEFSIWLKMPVFSIKR